MVLYEECQGYSSMTWDLGNFILVSTTNCYSSPSYIYGFVRHEWIRFLHTLDSSASWRIRLGDNGSVSQFTDPSMQQRIRQPDKECNNGSVNLIRNATTDPIMWLQHGTSSTLPLSEHGTSSTLPLYYCIWHGTSGTLPLRSKFGTSSTLPLYPRHWWHITTIPLYMGSSRLFISLVKFA